MFKVLIWDYAGVSGQWAAQVLDKKFVDVVGTITPKEPVSELLLKRDAWDWLLIFEQGRRLYFDATLQTLGLPLDKVIYALDINSWLQHPKAAFALTDHLGGGYLVKYKLRPQSPTQQLRHVHRRGRFLRRHRQRLHSRSHVHHAQKFFFGRHDSLPRAC